MGRPRKPLWSSGHRGFESHSFRGQASVTVTVAMTDRPVGSVVCHVNVDGPAGADEELGAPSRNEWRVHLGMVNELAAPQFSTYWPDEPARVC
jgi:hypothetical protein